MTPPTRERSSCPLAFTVIPSSFQRDHSEREAILANPGFGTSFTDHLVRISWTTDAGWHNASVEPYRPVVLDPAAAVFHYAQTIFEGLKAFRHADGSIRVFRPRANAARFQLSARRLAMPELAIDDFIESIRRLVAVDASWVPSARETSLYIRPFLFASEAYLGVRSARKFDYYVIASPAGPYFADGVKPVTIWLSTEFSRAGKGGMGSVKAGGNYAASLLPQSHGHEHGSDQVVFLDAAEGRYVEECGGMNVFFVYKSGALVTPASENILEGITKDSVIQLARDRGFPVEQRPFLIDEWRDGVASGDITEVFACGTAAGITPISQLRSTEWVVGDENSPSGDVTLALRRDLTDIQYGRTPDRHGWLMRVDS